MEEQEKRYLREQSMGLDNLEAQLAPYEHQLSRQRRRWAATGLVLGLCLTWGAMLSFSKSYTTLEYLAYGSIAGVVFGAVLADLIPSFGSVFRHVHLERNRISDERTNLHEASRTLASAYWLHFVLGGIATQLLLSSTIFSSDQQQPKLILVAMALAYRFWACLITWYAAGRYRGPHIWAILAKVAVAIGFVVHAGFGALLFWNAL